MWHLLYSILFGNQSGILLAFVLAFFVPFYLTIYLALVLFDIVSDILFGSIWHVYIYICYIVSFDLEFCLTYILAVDLAYVLMFDLACYLTFFLENYLADMFTFSLVIVWYSFWHIAAASGPRLSNSPYLAIRGPLGASCGAWARRFAGSCSLGHFVWQFAAEHACQKLGQCINLLAWLWV